MFNCFTTFQFPSLREKIQCLGSREGVGGLPVNQGISTSLIGITVPGAFAADPFGNESLVIPFVSNQFTL